MISANVSLSQAPGRYQLSLTSSDRDIGLQTFGTLEEFEHLAREIDLECKHQRDMDRVFKEKEIYHDR